MSLHMSKYHIVGNPMSRLIYFILAQEYTNLTVDMVRVPVQETLEVPPAIVPPLEFQACQNHNDGEVA